MTKKLNKTTNRHCERPRGAKQSTMGAELPRAKVLAMTIVLILTLLTLSAVYAATCTNPAQCRNNACCNETTNGARPYFNGSVCTSKEQTNETGEDCNYDGTNKDSGIKIGSMCVSKKDAQIISPSQDTWKWTALQAGGFICPDGNPGKVPTIDQLQQIQQVYYSNPSIKTKLNMTTSAVYWSSSEYNSSYAWDVYFGSGYGGRGTISKSNTYKVRCFK